MIAGTENRNASGLARVLLIERDYQAIAAFGVCVSMTC